MVTSIQEAIATLVEGRSLTQSQAAAAAEEIMSGNATEAQIGGFLAALRVKIESADEIIGMARVMREKSLHVPTDGNVIELVGTGGDKMDTLNVSTAASLVTAAAGLKVAKHGNRAASGRMGAADILEANGVKLELSPEAVKRCVDEVDFGFIFAPAFHPAMRFAAGPRRELGVRTVFNLMGPLTNPAGAQYQVLGVAIPETVGGKRQPELGDIMASVLAELGTKHSWVVHGDDGLDEITTTTTTQVWEVQGGKVRTFSISPEDAGIKRASLADIQVKDNANQAVMFQQSMSAGDSPAKDAVMLNAAAALVIGGLAADLRAGVGLAREAIDSGAALKKLRDLAELSQTLT
ncbi:MAG: anthranilate phosphoribosyltransferase [Chloroflexi bacterium]|nr:anthranilate phosphoribosyltransferase [Chloroflexota bacterium]